jgi:hypothetical protein
MEKVPVPEVPGCEGLAARSQLAHATSTRKTNTIKLRE